MDNRSGLLFPVIYFILVLFIISKIGNEFNKSSRFEFQDPGSVLCREVSCLNTVSEIFSKAIIINISKTAFVSLPIVYSHWLT